MPVDCSAMPDLSWQFDKNLCIRFINNISNIPIKEQT